MQKWPTRRDNKGTELRNLMLNFGVQHSGEILLGKEDLT